MSWCSRDKLRLYIDQADAGVFDVATLAQVPAGRLQEPHETCDLCA